MIWSLKIWSDCIFGRLACLDSWVERQQCLDLLRQPKRHHTSTWGLTRSASGGSQSKQHIVVLYSDRFMHYVLYQLDARGYTKVLWMLQYISYVLFDHRNQSVAYTIKWKMILLGCVLLPLVICECGPRKRVVLIECDQEPEDAWGSMSWAGPQTDCEGAWYLQWLVNPMLHEISIAFFCEQCEFLTKLTKRPLQYSMRWMITFKR